MTATDTATTTTGDTPTQTDLPPLLPSRWVPTDYPTPTLVDLYPASVTLPPGATLDNLDTEHTVIKTRVIITADPETVEANRLYVFVDSTIGPALIYTAATTAPGPTPPPASVGSRTARAGIIQTTAGPVSYDKEGGCGCGSGLKSFAPFTHPYSIA